MVRWKGKCIQEGWSKRKIARELGVDRSAVRRYLAAADSKPPTNPRTGFEPEISKPPTLRTGSLHLGGHGPESLCEAWKERIEAALAMGLSIQRIHQDLVAEQQFAGSYDSVWRFVRRLEGGLALPFRRLEVEPGAELQVDFGQGAWVIENGKRRRPHLFRAVLSHSRKGYSEAVWRQTTEIFIRCLENAFRYLGGVTRTVIIDNLGAAVSHADWFDPELNPIQSTYPNGTCTRTVYDDNGRASLTTDRNGLTGTRTDYDAAGRVTNTVRLVNVRIDLATDADSGQWSSSIGAAGTGLSTNATVASINPDIWF